ncbi:ROK family protein, partial [Lactobacillus sp. XV13L]|nr:ROK family protein [Lactobacillus sp. XV13L]
IAISAPGAVDSKKGIIRGISAVPYLHQRQIFKELKNEFSVPVTIENDANCAGLCEVNIGAGKEFRNVAFVVVGTGIGGAIFINKILYKGSHLFGGEFGLMKEADGPILSAHSTIVKASSQYERQKNNAKVDGKRLFALAAHGDQIARALINQVSDSIALALYNLQ